MLKDGEEIAISSCAVDHVVHHPEHLNRISEVRVKKHSKIQIKFNLFCQSIFKIGVGWGDLTFICFPGQRSRHVCVLLLGFFFWGGGPM